MVGSVWFPHAEDLGSLTLAIQALKNRYGFKGELHFKDINRTKLPFYEELARLLGNEATTFSFKAVSVERRGVGNVDRALRDLYYVLLREGVKHEVESRRAALPRKLQFLKDAEEPGSDKLLLEEVKDAMFAASANQFDNKLEPGTFEIEDSRLSELLQVADLFTSSVSRRLNAAGGRTQPKDEFAEYLVQAVNFTSATTKDEARGDAVYHLIL